MQRIVITGAGRRLGFELALHFVKKGWQVHATYRSEREQLEVLRHAGVKLYQVDFCQAQSVIDFARILSSEIAQLDLLVHNASNYQADDAPNQAALLQAQQHSMMVHFHAPCLLSEALYSALHAAQGQIIAMSDIYAAQPRCDFRTYSAAKAALESVMKSYAQAWAPNVRVNCIAPGPLAFLPEHDKASRERVLAQTPLARLGGFTPILQCIDALIENDYITGQTLTIDGGRSLRQWHK